MRIWKREIAGSVAFRGVTPDERGNVTLTLEEYEGLLRLAGYVEDVPPTLRRDEPAAPAEKCGKLVTRCLAVGQHEPPCRCTLPAGHAWSCCA